MDFIIHKLSLDMHSSISQRSISVKKGDTKRKICVTLTEKGKVFLVEEGYTAVFSAKKDNGGVLYNACNIVDGIIEYEFTEQTANIPGMMNCEIKLYDADNGLVTSPQFSIIVEGIVYSDEKVEASDEFSALTELMSSATELVNTTGEYADAARASATEAEVSNQVAGNAAKSAQSSASQANEQAQAAEASANRAEESASSAEESTSTVAEYMRRAEGAAVSSDTSAYTAVTAAEEARSYSSHSPIVGGDGCWWQWNGMEYVTTNLPSRGENGEKGDTGPQGIQGEKGGKGDPGHTPERGVDYYTEDDKQELLEKIDTALYDGNVSTSIVHDKSNQVELLFPDNARVILKQFYRWGAVCSFTIQLQINTKIEANYGFHLIEMPYKPTQRIWLNNSSDYYIDVNAKYIKRNGTSTNTGALTLSGVYLTSDSI